MDDKQAICALAGDPELTGLGFLSCLRDDGH
jgi:hypothetical protein